MIDSGGEVFKKITDRELKSDGKVKDLLIIEEKESADIHEGGRIEAGRMIEFAYEFKKWMEKELDVKIKKKMETPSRVSEELRVETGQGWEAFLDVGQSPRDQAELLKKLLEESIKPEERSELNYIDLRVKGKAIYK